jgi:hypothetical protein
VVAAEGYEVQAVVVLESLQSLRHWWRV